MASKENLLELSAIISRNWSMVIEEDDSYIEIYPNSTTICCCLQDFLFHTVCYDPRVGLNNCYWMKHLTLICNHLCH
jgi:hypothetical protein